MTKVFMVYGHYNDKSFNAAIKNTFIKTANEKGHTVDCVYLYKEKFDPVFSGKEPDDVVLNHEFPHIISPLLFLTPVLHFSASQKSLEGFSVRD